MTTNLRDAFDEMMFLASKTGAQAAGSAGTQPPLVATSSNPARSVCAASLSLPSARLATCCTNTHTSNVQCRPWCANSVSFRCRWKLMSYQGGSQSMRTDDEEVKKLPIRSCCYKRPQKCCFITLAVTLQGRRQSHGEEVFQFARRYRNRFRFVCQDAA